MSFHESFDLQILKLVNQPSTPILDTYFFPIFSYSLYFFLIFIAFYFFRRREKEKLIHLFAVVIVGFLFASALKYLFNVPRPFITFPEQVHALLFSLDPSFPSRHTFMAFLLLRFIPQGFPKFYKYLSTLYLLAIPLVQIHIGVHYPTDVLGGAALGYIFPTLLSSRICLKVWEKLPKMSLPF